MGACIVKGSCREQALQSTPLPLSLLATVTKGELGAWGNPGGGPQAITAQPTACPPLSHMHGATANTLLHGSYKLSMVAVDGWYETRNVPGPALSPLPAQTHNPLTPCLVTTLVSDTLTIRSLHIRRLTCWRDDM